MKKTFILLFLLISTGISAQISFPFASVYSYLTGDQASELTSGWTAPDFSSESWPKGTAPIGYGDEGLNTTLGTMKGLYSTVFMRASFAASNPDLIKILTLKANFDDGFVLWINGVEAARSNAPQTLNANALATNNHESGTISTFELDATVFNLKAENNSIAVQIMNRTLSSSDCFFDMALEGTPQLPEFDYGQDKVLFDHISGFYDTPFSLNLKSPSDSYSLKYTIDGSNPATSSTAVSASKEISFPVDPELNQGRGKTPAFIVRACLVKEGFAPSFSQAQTYIFTGQVRNQKSPGWEWPTAPINGKIFDYEMAEDVVNNPLYTGLLDKALFEIPTLSVATDMKNLFDTSTGIYVNPEQKGEGWERDCSVELINPDGTIGFQINAGLRIRGGNSAKNKSNAKNGFRLFFRSSYGTSELNYPLLGNEGVSEFDKIDLRCEQNYSWNMDGSPYNNLVKDIFCRDLLGAMKQPYSRGRYYHLYLNGMYWGIFQTDERPEANFAESYFGGDEEDYDVIKVNTQPWPYYNEATDGTMDSWEALWTLCQKGFETNEKYFALEGCDAFGKRDEKKNVWVDIDNLIDYMLVIFYSGNYDAPVSAWSGNDMPNNFFAIYNRVNHSMGYRFVNHDSEHCLFYDKVNIGAGLNENRVNIGTNEQMQITGTSSFNPQWLHYRLCANSEYRLRFADRASRYLSEGGLLSPETTTAMYQYRASQIDTAIIAESARWGDAMSWMGSLTRNDHWIPAIENMYTKYFPFRTNILIKQLEEENLYSKLPAPDLYCKNEKILNSDYSFSGELEVKLASSAGGTLFYTLDGTDPREPGGLPSASARQSVEPSLFSIASSTIIKARIKTESLWGPLKVCYLTLSQEDYSKLKLTELCYHPQGQIIENDTLSDESFEFIELKNCGTGWLDLSGCRLDSAIRYTFPDQTMLAPGQFYVVAGKTNRFYDRFGRYPSGNFQGKLSNSGEYLVLYDRNGNTILDVAYLDKKPWPTKADGKGSLVPKDSNPTGDPALAEYWRDTYLDYGSPFADDLPMSKQTGHQTVALKIYPNPTSGIIRIQSEEISSGSSLLLFAPDGRMVFSGTFDHNNTTIDLTRLGLSKGIYLLKVKTNGSIETQKIVYHPTRE